MKQMKQMSQLKENLNESMLILTKKAFLKYWKSWLLTGLRGQKEGTRGEKSYGQYLNG